ncbi:hypothetical protein AA0472_2592 [Acetobacter estunensis NRIC 0472]|uniref:DUF4412 domain-containing protein n=1 Tax=Acetobacter estunensis TaxID=104097 RepID=A0A967ECA5_9PROT|nr:hypothetical protein [Acetobacter estunensis]NHO52750.1 hypothetical protein [Acetobacter estunensis]GBQ28145.1 hypothetical protein AA0472_2592 [Acetobacter estunensis NRIC 0472]
MMGRERRHFLRNSGILALGLMAPLAAQADKTTGPYVTPSVDVAVTYELASPEGGAPVRQDMHWQVATLRQRIDPAGSAVYMITSWKDRTLTVVDTLSHRRSTMPAPGTALTLPGQVAAGSFARMGTDTVAGQFCTVWRTVDQDGRPGDACYTADGILVRMVQGGRTMVQAVSVERVPQPDALFVVPQDYSETAPAR